MSMEFSRQEYWSGLPFAPPGELPKPGREPASLMSPALAGRFFTIVPPGKPAPNPFPCLVTESRPLAQDGTSPGAHPAPDLPLGQLSSTEAHSVQLPGCPLLPHSLPHRCWFPRVFPNKILSTAKMGCLCLMGTQFQFKKMKQFWSSGDGHTIMWMHLITLNWIYN